MQKSKSNILKSSNLTEKIIEALPYYIYITDKCGKIIHINKNGADKFKSLGIDGTENYYDLFYKYESFLEDGKKIELEDSVVHRCLKYKEEVQNLNLKCNINGRLIYISMSAFPLIEEDEVIGAFLSI
jgi:transcriptional regulator with PAS, ATPase and Fis domain